MSGRKSKVVKGAQKPGAPKYASKYVEQVLNKLTNARIQSTKYPKTNAKWLSKMKSSILKKVSDSSKTLFQNDEDVSLKEDIQQLVQIIGSQRENLKTLVDIEAKATTTALNMRPQSSVPQTYQSGTLTESGDRLKDQYIQVAVLLSEVTQAIDPCTTSFSNCLSSVQSYMPILTEQLQPSVTMADGADGSSSSDMASSAPYVGSSSVHQVVQRHLGRK